MRARVPSSLSSRSRPRRALTVPQACRRARMPVSAAYRAYATLYSLINLPWGPAAGSCPTCSMCRGCAGFLFERAGKQGTEVLTIASVRPTAACSHDAVAAPTLCMLISEARRELTLCRCQMRAKSQLTAASPAVRQWAASMAFFLFLRLGFSSLWPTSSRAGRASASGAPAASNDSTGTARQSSCPLFTAPGTADVLQLP